MPRPSANFRRRMVNTVQPVKIIVRIIGLFVRTATFTIYKIIMKLREVKGNYRRISGAFGGIAGLKEWLGARLWKGWRRERSGSRQGERGFFGY